jgi:hypothetical protein
VIADIVLITSWLQLVIALVSLAAAIAAFDNRRHIRRHMRRMRRARDD